MSELHNIHDAEYEGQAQSHQDINPAQSQTIDYTLPD
jgi:hypothetical protein